MNSNIWRNLPTELVRRIVHESCPTIDVQLAFKINPKKIDDSKAWRLLWLLESHDGIFYNLETESLHIFRIPGTHVVRRPIKLDYIDVDTTSFNQEGHEHMLEITLPSGKFASVPNTNSWLTEFRVLLKGSGLARVISAAMDSSF